MRRGSPGVEVACGPGSTGWRGLCSPCSLTELVLLLRPVWGPLRLSLSFTTRCERQLQGGFWCGAGRTSGHCPRLDCGGGERGDGQPSVKSLQASGGWQGGSQGGMRVSALVPVSPLSGAGWGDVCLSAGRSKACLPRLLSSGLAGAVGRSGPPFIEAHSLVFVSTGGNVVLCPLPSPAWVAAP